MVIGLLNLVATVDYQGKNTPRYHIKLAAEENTVAIKQAVLLDPTSMATQASTQLSLAHAPHEVMKQQAASQSTVQATPQKTITQSTEPAIPQESMQGTQQALALPHEAMTQSTEPAIPQESMQATQTATELSTPQEITAQSTEPAIPQESMQATQTATELSTPQDTPERSLNCTELTADHLEQAYYNASICLTHQDILDTIKTLAFTAAEVFDRYNVTYWLESGTFLGSYREGGVIKHDRDADFGIDPRGYEFLQTNPIEVPPDYVFTVFNSSLYPNSTRDDKLPARLIHRYSGLYVDVFVFLESKDETSGQAMVGPLPSICFWGCERCYKNHTTMFGEFKIPRDWVYPLVDCPFEGRTLKCPREGEKYLSHMYGDNFMTPDK